MVPFPSVCREPVPGGRTMRCISVYSVISRRAGIRHGRERLPVEHQQPQEIGRTIQRANGNQRRTGSQRLAQTGGAVAGWPRVRRLDPHHAVIRSLHHAARPVRRRHFRLPLARLCAAASRRTPLVLQRLHGTARLRLCLRAAEGSDYRAALCALAEQDAAHLMIPPTPRIYTRIPAPVPPSS